MDVRASAVDASRCPYARRMSPHSRDRFALLSVVKAYYLGELAVSLLCRIDNSSSDYGNHLNDQSLQYKLLSVPHSLEHFILIASQPQRFEEATSKLIHTLKISTVNWQRWTQAVKSSIYGFLSCFSQHATVPPAQLLSRIKCPS